MPVTLGEMGFADTGSYKAAGQWIDGSENAVIVGAPDEDVEMVPFAGSDIQGSKVYGLRHQIIIVNVVYVREQLGDLVKDFTELCTALLAAQPFQIEVDGNPFSGCFLVSDQTKMAGRKYSGFGMYWSNAVFVVDKRTSPAS